MRHQTASIASWLGALAGILAAAAPAASAAAQCEWDTSLGNPGVTGDHAFAGSVAVWDDGTGERLYVGGRFESIGGVPATDLATWDAATGQWSAIDGIEPSPSYGYVGSFLPFDPGNGERLVVAGNFWSAGDLTGTAGLAMWNGAEWESMGTGWTREGHGKAFSMVEWEGRLYIGGGLSSRYDEIGGQKWVGLASWDGQEWKSHAEDLYGDYLNTWVMAMAVFNDGSGEALYVGGNFRFVDGIPGTGFVARFDGEEWSSVGDGIKWGSQYFGIQSMVVHDDGSGPALYVAGNNFTPVGERTANVAKWDGEKWTSIGPLLWDRVSQIAVFDDGSGPAIHIAGEYSSYVEGYPAKLSDGAWETVGGGVGRAVGGLTVIDGDLFVSGNFTEAGGEAANGLAIWTCSSCYADCDGSGDLDFFDFLCFQNEFAAGSAYADCDDNGELDFFDFLCFQNEFAAGCP